MQHQNAKITQHRDRQLPYFANVGSNVTNDYPASVLIGDFSPRRHLPACGPYLEVGTTTIHRPLTLDQRHAELPMCTSQKRTFRHCRPSGSSHLA